MTKSTAAMLNHCTASCQHGTNSSEFRLPPATVPSVSRNKCVGVLARGLLLMCKMLHTLQLCFRLRRSEAGVMGAGFVAQPPLCVCLYVCMYVCMHVFFFNTAFTYVCMYVHIYECVHMCACMYART